MAGCSEENNREAAARKAAARGDELAVFVSIPPQKYFVQRVGGEHVRVEVLVPPGQSPHVFEPTAKQMVRLASADAYFATGVPFEQQLKGKIGAAMRNLPIIDLTEGLERRVIEAHEHDSEAAAGHDDHVHGPDCSHEHGELDPHVWMNPRLVKRMAERIHEELCALRPADKDDFDANLVSFLSDLDDIDQRISGDLAPLAGREFYVFHPAFGYFAEAYGLKQVAVEVSGKEPTARQLESLISRARQNGVRLIFVQPQFSQSSAEAVARQIGGAVVPMDPLAEDYLANLEHMAELIEQAIDR